MSDIERPPQESDYPTYLDYNRARENYDMRQIIREEISAGEVRQRANVEQALINQYAQQQPAQQQPLSKEQVAHMQKQREAETPLSINERYKKSYLQNLPNSGWKDNIASAMFGLDLAGRQVAQGKLSQREFEELEKGAKKDAISDMPTETWARLR